MKLALIYDPNDPKLSPEAYSWTYRDMFLALTDAFESVQYVTGDGSAADIDADAIVFYDVHSSHHVKIDGIERHPAVKYEYFNDPHQREQQGIYPNGRRFYKLGAGGRCRRAMERGVRFIICPYRCGYERYIAPHVPDGSLAWFPVAPKPRRAVHSLLTDRKAEVLGNGHCWRGEQDFRPYEFRAWAFAKSYVTCVEHALDGRTPKGCAYQGFLSQYAGALALCDTYVVPKYLEIPMAGCLCLCQMQPDYAEMGFVDGVNCIAVDRGNLASKVTELRADPGAYQKIADSGRRLIEDRYTASHFAGFVRKHAEQFAKK